MKRRATIAIAVLAAATILTSCQGVVVEAPQSVVRVPQDAGTLQEAADAVAPNGLILIDSGTYTEGMELHTDGVTVRGIDRNEVVIDGEGQRANGIVASGSGITVENLTVVDHLVNGVLITGMVDENGDGIGRGSDGYDTLDPEKFPPVPGFTVRNVTAAGNALYGVYAFNRRDGKITDSYVSGSADSGIYVGQCTTCNVLIEGNVAQRNAIGIMITNASDVTVTANRLTDNRVGASLTSNHQEAYMPARSVVFAGNVVADNIEPDSPSTAEGAFGIGIGLSGTVDALVVRNRVSGHTGAGIALTASRDISASGNIVDGNALTGNLLDVATYDSAQVPLAPNCIRQPAATTWPDPLPSSQVCGDGTDDAGPAPLWAAQPPGVVFLDVRKPTYDLPSLTFADPVGDFAPARDVVRPDAMALELPDATLGQENER